MKNILLFISILLLLNTETKAAAWADTRDSLTLLKFQNEITALGWPTMYDSTKYVREWHGITLDAVTGKVESILIKGTDIGDFTTDTLPSCIQTLHALDSLETIYFMELGLKELPPEIGGFKNLTTLGLQHNNLLTVPEELGQLTALKYLFISSNKIMDLPDLSGLQNLIYLALTANWQLPTIPVTVFKLLKLQQLDIAYSDITYIPADIGNLTELKELRADAADLDSISPAVGDLSGLTLLHLNNNELTTLPESLGKLTKLTNLDISRNQLTALPDSLNQLVNLTGIGFTNNLLDSFPTQLVNLPKLININGENNRMKGSIPPALFAKSGLRLYLEGNELSGKLEIQSNKIPARLYIKNNRFTIKDIKEHYNLFIPANNTYIEFQPQKNIGTERTYYPESNSDFTVEIDNYIPAEGCTFKWLSSPYSNLDDSKYVSSNQVLEFQDFDMEADGGNYYCIVKHPDVPDLSLKSNTIRIIGTDKAPEMEFKNVLFRPDSIGIIFVYATDDYTPVDSLIYNFPEETEHFYLEPYYWPYKRKLVPKNNSWSGSDTLYFSVEDENGNIADAFAIITLLPVENTPPFINLPDIYMSFYQDYVPPCEPGTSGCDQQYVWECYTYLEQFVKDDFTPFDRMEFSILEVDASGQHIRSDKIHAYVNETMDGIHLDAYVFANYDTTFTLTLQAIDSEGGVSQQTVSFFASVSAPNENPVTDSVPTQIIYKNETQFPPLNLNHYVKDDYLPDSLLTWRGDGSILLDIEITDSIAVVCPKFIDSIFTTTYTYYVYEKTNEWKYSSVDVTYKVLELPKITGTITDNAGLPLENTKLIGFPETIYTDSLGNYEIEVPAGWGGKVYPELESYTFSPDTIEYANVLSDISRQDYTASIVLPSRHTVIFSISDGISQQENAWVDFNQSTYSSDEEGRVTISDVDKGAYSYTVGKNGFEEFTDLLTIMDSDTTVDVVLTRLTQLNEHQTLDEIYVYSNPFKNILMLEIPESIEINEVQICTLNGEVIKRIQHNLKGVIRINLSEYHNGVYIVKLFGNDTTLTLKVVKE